MLNIPLANFFKCLFVLNLFVVPCKGWTEEELKPIIEVIQGIVEKSKTSDLSTAPPIIAIGGCAGVGKSTITQLLQFELSELGISSVAICQDHYCLSQKEIMQLPSEMDPRRTQWNKLLDTLTSIRNGETEISKPIINQLTKEIGQETLQLANVDCVIFEGSSALADWPPMNLLQYADLKIYLETSLENIYDWKWQRELKKPVPRSSQAFYQHMIEIVKDFAFHVYPTRKNSDYIIQVDSFHHYSTSKAEGVKVRPEPDFTPFRLELLTY